MNKNVWKNIFVSSVAIKFFVILYICPLPIVTDTNELFENVLFANDLNLVTILLAFILILIIQSSNNYTHAEQPSCCGMCNCWPHWTIICHIRATCTKKEL